ncbi:histone-fold-containing protein, partial [Ramaria rubella]
KGAPKVPPNADRPPGKSLLPISRVQKIIKADKELPSCNKEAVFLVSVATEEFVKRLVQAGQQQASREKRTTVQRKDIVTAVRRADEFIFLE